MRDVRKPNFCKVCTEALWLSLLKRVNLLDEVREGCRWIHPSGDFGRLSGLTGRWQKTLDITLVPLAQFRKDAVGTEESYIIKWTKDGMPLGGFTNETRIEIDDEISLGTYTIEIKFVTEEVRLDRDNVLTTSSEFTVTKRCGQ
jgi:hypothetical protein